MTVTSSNQYRNNILSATWLVFRILIGCIFIFSGFVKGIDPLGTTYKLTDYFNAFHLEFLTPLSFTFAILLNMSEFILGVALIFGIYPKFFTWLALIYMAVFTPLTFVLALYDPVTDCGCFGDALIMTNWETFFKNLVITGMLIPVFMIRKQVKSMVSNRYHRQILAAVSILFILLSIYNYRHLPFIDFRPYKVGTNIPEGMIVPEGAPIDSFSYALVYEKEGIQQTFSVKDAPYSDTTWQWKETKTELIKEGYHPPIHDFAFTNLLGDDVTDSINHDDNFVLLAISYQLKTASMQGLQKLLSISDRGKQSDSKFYFATASTEDDIFEFRRALSMPFQFYTADEIMLKTIVRSNPGLVLIKNGTIIQKWHHNDFPEIDELKQLLEANN